MRTGRNQQRRQHPPAQPKEDNTIKQDESAPELEALKNIPPKEEEIAGRIPTINKPMQSYQYIQLWTGISKAGSGTGKIREGNGSAIRYC